MAVLHRCNPEPKSVMLLHVYVLLCLLRGTLALALRATALVELVQQVRRQIENG